MQQATKTRKKKNKTSIPISAKKKRKSSITNIYHLLVLDKSGSMTNVRDTTINGFNENVDNIKNLETQNKKQKHFVSLITFNQSHNEILWNQKSASLQKLSRESYSPEGMTALYDAMGFSINKLNKELKSLKKINNQNYNVLLTIITDGEENASKEYVGIENKGSVIAKLLEGIQKQNDIKWTVAYVGANHDVTKFAETHNILRSNAMSYNSSPIGTQEAFSGIKGATANYCSSVGKADVSACFFNDKDEVKDISKDINLAKNINIKDIIKNPILKISKNK